MLLNLALLKQPVPFYMSPPILTQTSHSFFRNSSTLWADSVPQGITGNMQVNNWPSVASQTNGSLINNSRGVRFFSLGPCMSYLPTKLRCRMMKKHKWYKKTKLSTVLRHVRHTRRESSHLGTELSELVSMWTPTNRVLCYYFHSLDRARPSYIISWLSESEEQNPWCSWCITRGLWFH